jgi:hypothetical protein
MLINTHHDQLDAYSYRQSSFPPLIRISSGPAVRGLRFEGHSIESFSARASHHFNCGLRGKLTMLAKMR